MNYCATIGFFDGVHLGHRYLIEQLKTEAYRRGLQSAILTFEQHPEVVLRGTPKPLLTTFEERTELLKQQEVDQIFCFNFEVISSMTAEEFMRILVANCDVRVLLMGYDHRFGSDRLSSFADYQAAAERVGLVLLPVHQAPEGDVSSSKIRRALQRGNVEAARIMLGYPYTLNGQVVHGRGLGRQMGFPTANLAIEDAKLLPANGVYSVRVANRYLLASSSAPLREEDYTLGLLNIGCNPTIGGDQLSVELHLPGFSGDLYDQSIAVQLMEFVREEKQFGSLEELQSQIREDLSRLSL